MYTHNNEQTTTIATMTQLDTEPPSRKRAAGSRRVSAEVTSAIV